MADLRVKLFDFELKNPVMPAAGPPVKDAKAAAKVKAGGAGAVVTKTISSRAARVPRPNMAQTEAGFLNAELWSELSPEQWCKKEYPLIKKMGLPVIVGLGYNAEDIKKLAVKVEPYADALELSTHYLGADPGPVIQSIKAAKKVTKLPVMVKLSPQINITQFAQAAEKAGADGLVLINSLGPGLDIDLKSAKPLMGSKKGEGWLSGSAIFPIALRAVFEAAAAVKIPVLAAGGISSGKEAVKMLMAGAQAVQVCTAAILNGADIYGKIAVEIDQYLESNAYSSLNDIRGLAQKTIKKEVNYQTKVPEIKRKNCTGCRICIKSCVYEANYLDSEKKIVINPEKCEGCGLCISRCNFNVLSLN